MVLRIPNTIKEQVIFVDTSAFYACFASNDSQHRKARDLFTELARDRWRLVTTNMVVAETYNLVLRELGYHQACQWLEVSQELNIERVMEYDEDVAREILKKNPQKLYSYPDATSFAVMLRLGLDQCVDFSNHYRDFGFFPFKDLPQILATTGSKRKKKK